jgi:PAS domain S-box-containing protein
LQNLLLNARADGKTAEINVRLPKSQALAAVSATPFRAGGGMRLLLRVRSAAAPASHGAEMNKTLALLVDSTRDGIVVTDSSGRILVANPAFLALVQTASEEEVRGRAIGEWLGRIEADVAALLAGAHAHGIAHLVRSSLRRHDGVSLDVDVTGAMLAEGEQECFGFTVRPCEARGDANAAWLKSLMLLEERVGVSTLPELMSQAQQMIEQRFVRLAMARAHGDVPAAAGVLGIAVEKLLRALALEDAAPAQPPTP